jgi:hypothetical protein
MALIKKYITIDETIWGKLKNIAKLPHNRRAVGDQVGIILKEYVDNNREMKQIWKDLLFEMDLLIDNTKILDTERLSKLAKKRALLESAFNRGEG